MKIEKKMMVDSHKRWINYLRISITNRCNLRCEYCVPDKGGAALEKKSMLSFDEILRIVKIMASRGLRKVRITGGEPLIRKGVTEFINNISQIDGIEDIGLTTNGVFLKEKCEELRLAGLNRINISMDTLLPEKFAKITKKDSFSKVWDGINAAESLGFSPIKLNVVLRRGINDDEIVDFARLTKERPFHIRFIEYMPVTQWSGEWKSEFMSTEDIKKRITDAFGEMDPLEQNRNNGPSINFRIKGGKGAVGFITAVSKHFCETCNRIRMTSDGKIKQCLFSNSYIDFKKSIREGCDDQMICNLLNQVMATKPEGHTMDAQFGENNYIDSMVGIGG